jgi:hypothetical protein
MLLASQVAIIIEKVMLHEQLIEKKRLEGQLEVARQVQLELLPAKDPVLEGYDISAYNYPTEEVSGDYYDWVKIYDDQIGLVIADVSGKGVPAALLMAFLRACYAHWLFSTHLDGQGKLLALGINRTKPVHNSLLRYPGRHEQDSHLYKRRPQSTHHAG